MRALWSFLPNRSNALRSSSWPFKWPLVTFEKGYPIILIVIKEMPDRYYQSLVSSK